MEESLRLMLISSPEGAATTDFFYPNFSLLKSSLIKKWAVKETAQLTINRPIVYIEPLGYPKMIEATTP